MENKDIEQLFKEKFKDFRSKPDERVWKSIQNSLDARKRKKRVPPIWWRLGGIAALLVLLFYIVNPLGDDNQSSLDEAQPQVSDTQSAGGDGEYTEEGAVQNTVSNPSKDDDQQVAEAPEGTETGRSSVLQSTSKEKSISKLASNTEANKQPENTENKPKSTLTSNTGQSSETTLENEAKTVSEARKEAIAQRGANEMPTEDGQVGFGVSSKEEAVAVNPKTQEEDEKKSILDAIAAQEEDENKLAQNQGGKWSVGPSVAPVYFDAIGQGSPIHSNFATNTKSGNLNLSYGLSVTYQINERLTVRSGVHKVDYGYDTNEIVFSSTLPSSGSEELKNIDYAQTSRGLIVESKTTTRSAAENAVFDILAQSPEFDGRMVQQMGYVEVPVELSYALVNKKFGVNVIGGFSSLFLVDNAVSLESQGFVTEMGEANNVNDVNFSANAGIGLDYQFTPKIRFSLEPVFKYQLNTFSDTAGDFRPYTIGVYSGVNFRF
ncbi:outer membrane beta-barrel protein [Flagellimonas lutaonensis]|uniref:Outer membrane protein beta-barrel domain-containing protein n=1 Tax=Flagellimonas lutaonensis TaxID=516051 RepID=A0A0D5YS08_9FLAO|nr:outer membrane beta-barrel protein [Allomuricauda lutaonensis]AKA35045.1 hypothetical protein VC82_1421 [Allomuricauda lutaonensis]